MQVISNTTAEHKLGETERKEFLPLFAQRFKPMLSKPDDAHGGFEKAVGKLPRPPGAVVVFRRGAINRR